MKVRPEEPRWAARDRFILSKGHACSALYAVLAIAEFFPEEFLSEFGMNGGKLFGHSTADTVPGVEVSTGSLGHGLAVGVGMALDAKLTNAVHRTFVLLSDGECNEGSTWEPVLFAAHHQLDNLAVIIDYNKIQSLGRVDEILTLEPFADKWRAFGWSVAEVDGHDLEALESCLESLPHVRGRPSCVVAHTIKGKGVSFMEDSVLWHYRCPRDDEFTAAKNELESAKS